MHHPTDRITHTTAFVTPVVEHWLVQEIAQWVGTKELAKYCLKTIIAFYVLILLHTLVLVNSLN